MYIVTFYSFKGGVGRTMALVNTGAELARRGRKVLLVDFDLEAPGLSTYDLLRPDEPKPGIVEFVTQFRDTWHSPLVTDFIYEPKGIAEKISAKGGKLWVMPAGRGDTEYKHKLNALNWQKLYKEEDGFLLFEDARLQWEAELHPDYVLIDARTGHTDIEGICTRQLADAVVLMFMPNEQNLAGLENVCRDIRREATEGLKKTIRLHFVAANVPDLDDEKRILHRHKQAFRKRLDFKDFSGEIRRYENFNLLDQSVFTLDRPHTRLARAYRRLLRTLLKDNPADREGAMIFLQDYPERHEMRNQLEKGEMPPKLRATFMDADGNVLVNDGQGRLIPGGSQWEDKKRLHEIARHFDGDAEILNKVAECFMVEEDFKSTVQILDRALESNPDFADVLLLRRARCNTNLGRINDATDDLLACLRAPASRYSSGQHAPLDKGRYDPHVDYAFFSEVYHRTAVVRLHALAPARMFEVADLIETQGFQARWELIALIADYLSATEDGLPRAARLLRAYMDKGGTIDLIGCESLLRARCWREVIQLHESEKLGAKDSNSLLELALARWGREGEIPESLCKQALETGRNHHTIIEFRGLAGIALLSWGAGQMADALTILEEAEQKARAETDDSFSEKKDEVFSVWRFREVSIGQFLDDCSQMRRMFQGQPLRPAFLGPPR